MNENGPRPLEKVSPDDPPPSTPPEGSSGGAMALAGFFSVAGLTLLATVDKSGAILIFDVIGVPLIAIILAIIPATRKLGLGALLAWGLGAMVLFAICGRGLKNI